ncbi:MAG: HAMP domain-containing histidine kinase [Proteobacteria bacterium]|nr:HAMP domain-containing histidine kinase [Pseudomonadota bacterium]
MSDFLVVAPLGALLVLMLAYVGVRYRSRAAAPWVVFWICIWLSGWTGDPLVPVPLRAAGEACGTLSAFLLWAGVAGFVGQPGCRRILALGLAAAALRAGVFAWGDFALARWLTLVVEVPVLAVVTLTLVRRARAAGTGLAQRGLAGGVFVVAALTFADPWLRSAAGVYRDGVIELWAVVSHPVAVLQILAIVESARDRAERALRASEEALRSALIEQRGQQGELAAYREQLEQLVEERTRELERSRQLASIGTLATGIAHQIRNPLGAILLAAQDARAEPEAAGSSRAALATVEQEARRAGAIVKSLLGLVRGDLGERWCVALDDVLAGACAVARPLVEARGGKLHARLQPGKIEVQADPVQLEQVLVNVIQNAAESRPLGVDVWLSREPASGCVRIRVEDNGPGIPDAVRARVFEPFYTTRSEEGGTGLGLALANRIVRRHRGQMGLGPSRERGGTCVWIELPAEP